MVFQKQLNEKGNYIGQDRKRYEILSCLRTESMQWCETGEVDENGAPVMAKRLVINKGWDSWADISAAAAAYGLTYVPKGEK